MRISPLEDDDTPSLYLLDTNAVSNYLRGSYPLLTARIESAPVGSIWVSGIAVAEILKGRLSDIATCLDRPKDIGLRFEYLVKSMNDLREFDILPYDEAAVERYFVLRKQVKAKAKPNDQRIAASALAYGMTVITADKTDFSQIPRVRWEDWSK